MKEWGLSGEEIKKGVEELMKKTTNMYDQIAALNGDQVRKQILKFESPAQTCKIWNKKILADVYGILENPLGLFLEIQC